MKHTSWRQPQRCVDVDCWVRLVLSLCSPATVGSGAGLTAPAPLVAGFQDAPYSTFLMFVAVWLAHTHTLLPWGSCCCHFMFIVHRLCHCSCSIFQDGTVRVWDCSSYSCVSIIHPNPAPSKDAPGPVIPLDQPRLLLKCAKSPGNSCVRFDAGGGWLLIGNTDGQLVLWNCKLNSLVTSTQCVKDAGGAGDSSSSAGLVPQVGLLAVSVSQSCLQQCCSAWVGPLGTVLGCCRHMLHPTAAGFVVCHHIRLVVMHGALPHGQIS